MKKLLNNNCAPGFYKVILEIEDNGVDLYAYISEQSKIPEWDYFLDDLEKAKQFSFERFGTQFESWIEI